LAASRKSPQDATGRKAALLAEANADKLAERAGEISTINPMPVVESDTEVTVGAVSVDTPTRKMRVNTDLEQVTIGHGNNYDFYRGQTYTVPVEVYNHLDERGLVWH